MGISDKEIVILDKKEDIHFKCSPVLKRDFTTARTELGEFNTDSAFFVSKMTEYISKHRGEKNGQSQ